MKKVKIKNFNYITVGKMKEMLSKLNDIIIMSKDEEGNMFSPLADLEKALYKPITTWYGDTSPRKSNKWVDEEDILKDGIKAIVLYPIN